MWQRTDSELEGISVYTFETENQGEKRLERIKTDDTRKRERTEEIFETIMNENFPKMMSDTKTQNQDAPRTSSRINAKRPHIGILFSNYRK